MKSKSILLFISAHNFNDQEFLIIKKQLESASFKIFIASDSNSLCEGSSGLKIKNDIQLYNSNESNFAGLLIIGGTGIREYWNNSKLHSLVKAFNKNKKPIGAICSAVMILANSGILKHCATCYEKDKLELEKSGASFKDSPVVIDENIITGQYPAAASIFAASFINLFPKS